MSQIIERTSAIITAPRVAFRRFSRHFGTSVAGLEELVKPEESVPVTPDEPQINQICVRAQDALDLMTCKKRPDASYWGNSVFNDLSKWRTLWFFQTAFNREIKRVTPIRPEAADEIVRRKSYDPKDGFYKLEPVVPSVRLLLTTENWLAAKAGDQDALKLLKAASIRSS